MVKWLVRLVFVFVVLVLGIWFGGPHYFKRSLARYEGSLELVGLDDSIRIDFDEKGIPQIRASTDGDALFGLGWCHASERLFQMELMRRVAAGTLSELFGEATLEYDRLQRKIGFSYRAGQNLSDLDDLSRVLLTRYTEGINAWIEHAQLPPEFQLLRLRPEPWTAKDSLALSIYQTWFSHELVGKDQSYAELFEQLGPHTIPLIQAVKPWSPTTLDEEPVAAFHLVPLALKMAFASNSWAVSPAKSASGHAIHASDPHLAIDSFPGLWYLAGLHVEGGLNVLGVSCPGLPFVAMGHNGQVAWSFTVSSVDVIDHYRYKKGVNPNSVLAHDGEMALETRYESIDVKGGETELLAVNSVNGEIVIEEDETSVLTLRWAGFDRSAADMIASGWRLNRARDFDDFRESVTALGALDANWIYSDRSGQIGYQLGTPIPIRGYADSYSELDGSDPSLKWRGYRPLEETPHQLNPSKAWLASCNNQIVPSSWPYPIPGFYDPYRVTRINEMMRNTQKLSGQDMAAMQLDRVSGVALRWRGLLVNAAKELNNEALAVNLARWDARMDPESSEAAVFACWWEHLSEALFQDQLGDQWRDGKSVQEDFLTFYRDRDDPRLLKTAKRTLADILPMVEEKTYGDLCQLEVVHPLARVPLLDQWLNLNRGPYPWGGDNGSLNANFRSYDPDNGLFRSRVGPSMRFVLDWADLDQFQVTLQLGQSGHPMNPHYDDFYALWESGSSWRVPFNAESIVDATAKTLVLNPAP